MSRGVYGCFTWKLCTVACVEFCLSSDLRIHVVIFQAFDKAGLRIEFSPTKPDPADPSKSTIRASFSNTCSEVRLATHHYEVAGQENYTVRLSNYERHGVTASWAFCCCRLVEAVRGSHPSSLGTSRAGFVKLTSPCLHFSSRVCCWPLKISCEHELFRNPPQNSKNSTPEGRRRAVQAFFRDLSFTSFTRNSRALNCTWVSMVR